MSINSRYVKKSDPWSANSALSATINDIRVIQNTSVARLTISSNALPFQYKYSVVGKHLKNEHQVEIIDLDKYSSILRKCQGKLDCLIYKMSYSTSSRVKRTPTSNQTPLEQKYLFDPLPYVFSHLS